MTLRPFKAAGIGELEELVALGKPDMRTLVALKGELSQRHVPRASKLLRKVESAIAQSKAIAESSPRMAIPAADSEPAENIVSSAILSELPEPAKTPFISRKPRLLKMPLPPLAERLPGVSPLSAPRKEGEPHFLTVDFTRVSLANAYQTLNASDASSWESIENTRRELVQKAHPERIAALSPARRAQVEAEARAANEAYETLRQIRDY